MAKSVLIAFLVLVLFFVPLASAVNVSVKAHVVVGGVSQSPLSGAAVTYLVGSAMYSGGSTDASGYASQVTLQPGQQFQVKVVKSGYTTTTSSTFTVPSTSPYYPTVSLAVPSAPPSNILVRALVLTSPSGYPIAGATVTYTASGATYSGGSTTSTGLANTVGLQPGQFVTISVSKSGYQSATKTYTVLSSPSSQSVTVNLTASAPSTTPVEIKARALVGGISQSPLAGASITYLVGSAMYSGGTTDSQGYATQMVTLQSGQAFQVKVVKSGYTTVTSQTFTVPSSSAKYSPVVSVAQPSTNIVIKAKVVVGGISQTPLSGATVTYLVGSALYSGQVTDSSGIAGQVVLQPGQAFQVKVEKSGYTTVVSQSFTVPSTSPYNPVVSMAVPTASAIIVKAKVVVGGISQTPLAGATVTYTADSAVYSGGVTDASGYANFVGLQSGQSVSVRVEKTGYSSVTQSFAVPSSTPYYPVVSMGASVSGCGNGLCGSDESEQACSADCSVSTTSGSVKVRVTAANQSFLDETVLVGESFWVNGKNSYANQLLRVQLSSVAHSAGSGALSARLDLYDSLSRLVNTQTVVVGADVLFQTGTGTYVVVEQLHVEAINSSSPTSPASNCVAHSSKSCVNGDVYWKNSCGTIEDRFDDCQSNESCSGAVCVATAAPVCAGSGSVSSLANGNMRVVISNPNGNGVQLCVSGEAACATLKMECSGIESRATSSNSWMSSGVACSRTTPLASLNSVVYSAICKPSSIASSKIRAKVYDYSSSGPLSGASVSLIVGGTTYDLGTTNLDGYSNFSLFLPVGSSYTLVISKSGYSSLSRTGIIRGSYNGQTRYFRLNPLSVSSSLVTARVVTSPSGYPVNAARVTFSWIGAMEQVVLTNSDGVAQVSIPRGQEFSVKVDGSGIGSVERSYIVPSTGSAFEFSVPVTIRA